MKSTLLFPTHPGDLLAVYDSYTVVWRPFLVVAARAPTPEDDVFFATQRVIVLGEASLEEIKIVNNGTSNIKTMSRCR